MKIIANAGQASSTAVESFKLSSEGKYNETYKMLEKANKYINEAIKNILPLLNLKELEFNLNSIFYLCMLKLNLHRSKLLFYLQMNLLMYIEV